MEGRFQAGDSHGGQGRYRVPSGGNYDKLVIFLHGLGDTAEGWESGWGSILMKERSLAQRAKIILPTAPVRPIALNGNMPMPGWSNIYSLDMDGREDFAGFCESRERVRSLIREELAANPNLKSTDIVIGGFSQGGATCYLTALSSDAPLAGVVICSGWVPCRDEALKSATEKSKTIPMLHCHGLADDVVAFKYGEASATLLKQQGYNVTLKRYQQMGHWVVPQEISDVVDFLREHLLSQN